VVSADRWILAVAFVVVAGALCTGCGKDSAAGGAGAAGSDQLAPGQRQVNLKSTASKHNVCHLPIWQISVLVDQALPVEVHHMADQVVVQRTSKGTNPTDHSDLICI